MKMIRKITGNIMAIMLAAGMFLGAAGVVMPAPVHAEEEYPGPYELTVKLDKVFNEDGQDVTSEFTFIGVHIGDRYEETYKGREITISRLSECPLVFSLDIHTSHFVFYGATAIPVTPPGGTMSSYPVASREGITRYFCTVSHTVTRYHEKDGHVWKYSADGNVITAECTAEDKCYLETPTLTLKADDKEYDGKPAATVSPNSTWTTANGLPEADQSNIIYSSGSPKKAGTYTASYTVDGATVTKQYTVKKKNIFIGGFEVRNKDYDGTTKAAVDTSKARLYYAVPGDDIGCKVTAEFENADPGDEKTVYLTYKLTGADAENYELLSWLLPKKAKAYIYPLGRGGDDEEADEGSSSGNGTAANSSKSSPDTGDTNDITGLLAMMLASAAALGAMGFRRIREDRK